MSNTPTAVIALNKPANGDAAWDTSLATNWDLIDAFLGWTSAPRSVLAISTVNLAVASAVVNGATIGGVVVATGDRVGLVGQTAGAENGIYIVAVSGAASRATDANIAGMFKQGQRIYARQGTSSNRIYRLTNSGAIVLGTTVLTYALEQPTETGDSPTFVAVTVSGTVSAAFVSSSGNISSSGVLSIIGGVSSIAGALDASNYGWRVTGFGNYCQLETQQVEYNYGGFGGFVNTSDGRVKIPLADRVDYRAAVRNTSWGDAIQYADTTKTGIGMSVFGLHAAQQAYAMLGDFPGLIQPHVDGELWKATQEPWAFLALKVLGQALQEIDELKAKIATMEAV